MNAAADSAVTNDPYRKLLEEIGSALRNEPGSFALLLIEVSNLCDMYSRLGFEATAALMRRLEAAFSQAMQGRGSVSRFRDGSFCALVNGIRNTGHAQLAAEKLWRAMDDTVSAAGVRSLDAHVGIAMHPSNGATAEELVRKAQLAATAARKRVRRVLGYDDECAAAVLGHWALSEAFAGALEAGEVSMHYQPKVRIADSRTTGAEALMRWLKDGEPVAAPDVFIPLAEEAGLTQATTWYALSNALRQSAELGSMGVAVNVSPAMLHHREFLDMVQTAVENWQTRPGQLTLEVTEGALIADFEQAIARLSRLRDLGIRISIDDFGTGYSSLSYFKKIPAHELKIDKSFVSGLLHQTADRRLIETIVTLASQFRLDIVAEGVEDRATLEALATLGCDYAQGHLFAPALRFEEFRNWLAGDGAPRG